MLANIIGFIVGILALIGAGVFSYLQLEQSMGPRPEVEVLKPAVIIVQKETASTTVSKSISKPIVKVPLKKEAVKTPVSTNGSLVPRTPTTVKNVVEPGPLRVTTPAPATSTELSVRGVIEYTNGARSLNGGLPALIENQTLNRNAQIKVDDMFAKQYFEHESPTGVGPGDLAKMVGYEFVIVGENLALGDFDSDKALVEAWMNSPGHRANILNVHYQEIGVAVKKGMYEGRLTWLAVQSFGMPLSACPAINTQKKTQIDTNNTQILSLAKVLDEKKARIDTTLTSDPNYNTYVNDFNVLLPEYNTLVEYTRVLVTEYNATVQAFNSCIASATGTN